MACCVVLDNGTDVACVGLDEALVIFRVVLLEEEAEVIFEVELDRGEDDELASCAVGRTYADADAAADTLFV